MASSQTISDAIYPNESVSQTSFDAMDLDDDIHGEQDAIQSSATGAISIQSVSTTLKKGRLFYVHNERDKEMVASILKVSPPLTSLTEG